MSGTVLLDAQQMEKVTANPEKRNMSMEFYRERKKHSRTRRLPLLPRVGIYVDWAGYEMVLKFAPLLEALVQLPERGMSVYQLMKLSKEQLAEIKFPVISKSRTINTTARTVSVKQRLKT